MQHSICRYISDIVAAQLTMRSYLQLASDIKDYRETRTKILKVSTEIRKQPHEDGSNLYIHINYTCRTTISIIIDLIEKRFRNWGMLLHHLKGPDH